MKTKILSIILIAALVLTVLPVSGFAAEVISVEINESLKASRVVVPDDKLSLAIGKMGQNVRLAARLTGWKIDVKPKSKVEIAEPANIDYEITELDDEDTFADLEDIVE